MTLNWFLSSTVRQANAMRKHVQKLLDHQRDILPPQAVTGVQTAIENMRQAIAGQGDNVALEKQMTDLEAAANKWLKPYPNAAWRENVEVLLVALSVAMGIRTFFLQPFKIPTGSMQPTLFGVTSTPDFSRGFEEPSAANANFVIPTGWQRVRDWFAGISYLEVKAKVDGTLEHINKPFAILIFNIYQTLQIGGTTHLILFPPDYGSGTLEQRAGLHIGTVYKKGDDVVRMKIASGDHLFVDRVSYNFRRPQRGEIVVFDTHGLPLGVTPDTFYIKRLVGLGDETLALKQNYTVTNVPGFGVVPVGHLVVNGKQITASDPGFQNVYSFYGAIRGTETLAYKDNHYFGHGMIGNLVPGSEFRVTAGHYFVMGDNTMNSSDSRYWGDFPEEKVIGKSFFVYWPITDRFGWNYR
jgi:signal peptidase I